jgi:hypothetical protein
LAWRRLARAKREQEAQEETSGFSPSEVTDANAAITVPEHADVPAAAPDRVRTMAPPESRADS